MSGEVFEMSDDLEITLTGANVPRGEISLRDLAAIASSLQELSLRLTRHCVDAAKGGRPSRDLEALSQLRLKEISAGSTRLLLSRGPGDTLDVELPVQAEVDRQLDEIIHAMNDDKRPDWVPDTIADSVVTVVRALKSAAPVVETRLGRRAAVQIRTEGIHHEVWSSPRSLAGDSVEVTGLLEKVDLRSHDFRIRDDVGNTIELTDVPDDRHMAGLIDHQVIARGEAVLNRSGRLTAVSKPELTPDDSPLSASRTPPAVQLSEILTATPGPDADGVVDLTDEEFAVFLEAVRS